MSYSLRRNPNRIGRTGSLLAVCGSCKCKGHCERKEDTYVRPDILILGKALGGGFIPFRLFYVILKSWMLFNLVNTEVHLEETR